MQFYRPAMSEITIEQITEHDLYPDFYNTVVSEAVNALFETDQSPEKKTKSMKEHIAALIAKIKKWISDTVAKIKAAIQNLIKKFKTKKKTDGPFPEKTPVIKEPEKTGKEDDADEAPKEKEKPAEQPVAPAQNPDEIKGRFYTKPNLDGITRAIEVLRHAVKVADKSAGNIEFAQNKGLDDAVDAANDTRKESIDKLETELKSAFGASDDSMNEIKKAIMGDLTFETMSRSEVCSRLEELNSELDDVKKRMDKIIDAIGKSSLDIVNAFQHIEDAYYATRVMQDWYKYLVGRVQYVSMCATMAISQMASAYNNALKGEA